MLNFKQYNTESSTQLQERDNSLSVQTTYTHDHNTAQLLVTRFINSHLHSLQFTDIITIAQLTKLSNNLSKVDNDTFIILAQTQQEI